MVMRESRFTRAMRQQLQAAPPDVAQDAAYRMGVVVGSLHHRFTLRQVRIAFAFGACFGALIATAFAIVAL